MGKPLFTIPKPLAYPGVYTLSFLMVLGGCQSYTAQPLTNEAVDAELQTPELDSLAGAYQADQHPLLPPIEVDLSDGINPTEAACLAAVLNTGLRAERARRGIVVAQLIQAGLLPNPVLSLSADHPNGGATAGAINAYGVGVDWDVGALIEHGANLKAAKGDDRAAAMDLLWQEWQVACAARLAVTQAAWLETQQAALQHAAEQADSSLGQLRSALAAGLTTRVEVSDAESTLQGFVSQAMAAARARDLALLDAKRAIGLPPDAELSIAPAGDANTSPPLPLGDLAAVFAAARDTRVDLAALRAGYQAQEERVRAAVLAQFPRFSVGINTARDTGNVKTIGLGVSIDLPIFDRSQGRIASERATVAQHRGDRADRPARVAAAPGGAGRCV